METKLAQEFKQKCTDAVAKIQGIDAFRESDAMVGEVLRAGKWLFQTPLDRVSPDTLLRIGGKLVGAYAYLGQKSSRARAERDVYEQKLDETEKELTLQYLDGEYKVTEVRALVARDVAELKEFVLEKEVSKNNMEHIVSACQTMVMFIQSALKSKEGEKFNSSRMHDNG